MNGWFRFGDIVCNITIFASFVVLPLLLIACEINDVFEGQKMKEQRMRRELRKEAEIEIKKEKKGRGEK